MGRISSRAPTKFRIAIMNAAAAPVRISPRRDSWRDWNARALGTVATRRPGKGPARLRIPNTEVPRSGRVAWATTVPTFEGGDRRTAAGTSWRRGCPRPFPPGRGCAPRRRAATGRARGPSRPPPSSTRTRAGRSARRNSRWRGRAVRRCRGAGWAAGAAASAGPGSPYLRSGLTITPSNATSPLTSGRAHSSSCSSRVPVSTTPLAVHDEQRLVDAVVPEQRGEATDFRSRAARDSGDCFANASSPS